MRADFYQLSRDPAERAVALIARSTLKAGARLLVVADDAHLLDRIDTALWQDAPDSFLAHGRAGGPDDARQPVLLGERVEAGNGARYVVLADGLWREAALGFDRVFLMFGADNVEAARATWRMLGQDSAHERHFWKQDGGKWARAG